MSSAANAFRDRAVLFAILLVVLAGNVAILLAYRTFYDVRLRALVSEQASLETRRNSARIELERAVESERRLFETQETLTAFFSETLGRREERIASLIEDVYRMTREAGLRPDSISYESVQEPGTDALTLSFAVSGPYRDVKRLLSEFERSKRFLVVENLALAGGSETDPDSVSVSFTLTNFFRPASLKPIRQVKEPAGPASPRPAGRGATDRRPR